LLLASLLALAYIIKPLFLSKVFRDLDLAEDIAFGQSETKIVAVRPPGLKNKPPTRNVAFLDATDLSPKSAEISCHDVALAMLQLCESSDLFDKWEGKGVSVIESN